MSAIAPSGALAPSAPLSGFSSAVNTLRLAVAAAASSCAADGGSGAPPAISLAVMSDGVEALVKTLPGSILVLGDGSFRVTSLETPFGSKRAHGLPDVFISEKVEVPAKAVKQDWLIGNAEVIFMGVMTEGGLAGSRAADLTIQGQPASIEVDGTAGEAITKLKVTVQGAAPRTMEIGAALALLKVSPRLFKGGQEAACLLSGGGTPTLAAARAASLTGAELAIGSPLEPLVTARLQMMGLFASGTSTCTAAQAATLLCGLVGMPRLEEAITLCLACSATAIGPSPSPEQAGVTGARSALLGAFSRVVHIIPPPALELAVVKMTAMATAGFALGQGCGGAIIFQSVAESEPPAILPMPGGLDAGRAAMRLLNAAALPFISSPAALTVPPGVGAGLSPESALEAQIAARRLALESIRAAKAQSAAVGGGQPFPVSASAGGEPLCGFAYLRPPPIPPAAPFTDLELLVALGGAEVARRLAASACNLAPLISMAGPGSVATAVEAASDFSTILTAVRAGISSPAAVEEASIMSSSAPRDIEEAGTRLRVVLRKHQDTRLGARVAIPPSPDAVVSRPRHSDRSVKVVPASAPAERVFRAVGASVLEPLCIRTAARGVALSEPIDEGRRLVEAYGRGAVGYILSSGEVDGETSLDPHGHLVAARTAVSGYINRWLEDVATPQRVRSVAAETQLLRADIQSLDLNWDRIQVRCGGLPPKGAQWLTARPELANSGNSAIIGRWGTLKGPLAYGDCERAARIFGPLLITLQVDLAGGPPASGNDETLGLLPFVQATVGLSDEARSALMQEAVERFSLQHREVRLSAVAKPADPEEIFLDAQINAVQPITDSAASVQAGAAAGAAAAKAAIDAHSASLKKPAAAVVKTGPDAPTWAEKRKAERDAKRLAAKKQSVSGAAPPAPSSAPLAAAAAQSAGGQLTVAVAQSSGQPPPPRVQVKQWEPFTSGEPCADSITVLCDRAGGGLVEILDRLHHFAAPNESTDKFPCAWRAATGKCSTHADPAKTCRKCENQAAPKADVLSRAKAACSAALLRKLAGSDVANAA